jgi:RNA polymerase sigma-70 factor (ECF subfamily)
VHSSASTWAETDWLQIAMLYDMLAQLDGSPIVRLNQAIAMSHVCGTDAALAAIDEVADRLDGYHLLHATRAELLSRRGDHKGARVANARALELTDNPAEQALLLARLGGRVST